MFEAKTCCDLDVPDVTATLPRSSQRHPHRCWPQYSARYSREARPSCSELWSGVVPGLQHVLPSCRQLHERRKQREPRPHDRREGERQLSKSYVFRIACSTHREYVGYGAVVDEPLSLQSSSRHPATLFGQPHGDLLCVGVRLWLEGIVERRCQTLPENNGPFSGKNRPCAGKLATAR